MVRDRIRNNMIMTWLANEARNRCIKHNREILKYIKKLEKIDSIKDFELFKKEIQPLVHSTKMLSTNGFGNDALHYGYYNEMLSYANNSGWILPLFSNIEHGIRFISQKWELEKRYIAYACQGRERVNDVLNEHPDIRLYVLGPYIHYARPYYGENEFKKLKSELGKVLLVLPSHSCEMRYYRVANNLMDIIYEKYAKNYDSVMVCVYWNDVNEEEILAFKDRGAIIVSAGFREDKNFIRRLKTIISLADEVVGNDIGTNIGFCLYMNKPYTLEALENRIPNDQMFTENVELFRAAFCKCGDGFTEEQIALQNDLFIRFWGGYEEIKSPEEMNRIFNYLKGVCKNQKYSFDAV